MATPTSSGGPAPSTNSPLSTEDGTTSVADSVVVKVAGIAARQIDGVHELGGGGSRAVGSLRQRVPGAGGPDLGQGVSAEVGEHETTIDIDVVLDYGVSIVDVTQAIRRNVITSVEGMTGLQVSAVNIDVDDIYIPEDDSSAQPQPSRVQ
jgi:uncharacterized alkaline shock family protein YloU